MKRTQLSQTSVNMLGNDGIYRRIAAWMGVLLFAATASSQVHADPSYAIRKSAINGGGVTFHSGGGYRLGGTVGQHDAGVFSGGGYNLIGGFWSPERPPAIIWNSDPMSSTRATRSITVSTAGVVSGTWASAIQLTMLDLQSPSPANPPCCPPPNFGTYESATCNAVGETNECVRWVGPPVMIQESQGVPALGTFLAARLQCTPYYTDWTGLGAITVFGAEIMPSSTYELTAFGSSCTGAESACTNTSVPVQAMTRRSGDVAGGFNPPSTSSQPDALDVVALVNKFRNLTGSPSKRVAQIQPNLPELNADVNALDIVTVVDAFRGLAYPFSGPCPCPSAVTCNATACTSAAQCSGGLCVKTCSGGSNLDQPCLTNAHCPGSTCGTGSCRDRCGRCN